MNPWSEYELLFDILVLSLNVLTYAAFLAGIIEKIIKMKGREKNDRTV